MRYSLAASFILSSSLCMAAHVSSDLERSCASRATIRHIEPKGIGYDQGYTTLELFFSPETYWKDSWTSFLDLRGHIFDNGTNKAANVGAGVRYVDWNREMIWGLNGYYDFHNTKYHSYNQFGLGLEWIGKVWDARLNGYLPFGKKLSGFINAEFGRFQGNQMLLSREYEFAMKGANAEVGYHVDDLKYTRLYFAGGPYYLNGRGRAAFGGEIRAVATLFDMLRLEANASYDHIFKWIGQGSVGLTFSLCPKRKRSESAQCGNCNILVQRSHQRADRFEIIPIKDPAKLVLAINPNTDQPYIFSFIDNTSTNSLGTIENPFDSLSSAVSASVQNQAIYLLSGDGTTTNLTGTHNIKNNQMYLGASTPQIISTTLGPITVPALQTTMPKVAASFRVANNNTISGLYFDQPGGSLSIEYAGTGTIESLHVLNNVFELSAASRSAVAMGGSGTILLLNSTNNLYMNANNVLAYGIFVTNGTVASLNSADDSFKNFTAIAMFVDSTGTIENLTCTRGTFDTLLFTMSNNSYGVATSGTLLNSHLSNSTFTNLQGNSGAFYSAGSTATSREHHTISNCIIGDANSNPQGILLDQANPSNNVTLSILNNKFYAASSADIGYGAILTAHAGSVCLNLQGNVASSSTSNVPYSLNQTGMGVFNRTAASTSTNNIGQISTTGTVNAPGSCTGQ